jgi:hypothetical protein
MKQLLLIVAITIAGTSGAHAQPADGGTAAKLPLARRFYEEGVDAIGKARWSNALDRFKASYELAPRVLTLFNLAYAQAQTGRLVEATESYRRFLRETTDGRYPELRPVATSQLELLDKQIAQVTIDVTNLDDGDVVAIDDLELPRAALREAIPMNPGAHVARVQRGARVIATRTLALAAGAPEAVRIELPVKPPDLEVHHSADPPAVTALPPGPVRVDHGPSHAWLRSPWLWSGVAIVVAGTATGAYLMTRPDGVTVH